MPRATTNQEETTRHELVSLPEGFIVLRKLTFGQSLQRQSLLTMRMIRDAETKAKGVSKGEFNMANAEVTAFDFSHCIVDHNLEDETGRKLNLGNPHDLQRLDPRIGQEIDQIIQKQNAFDEDELGNSEPASEA